MDLQRHLASFIAYLILMQAKNEHHDEYITEEISSFGHHILNDANFKTLFIKELNYELNAGVYLERDNYMTLLSNLLNEMDMSWVMEEIEQ